MASATMPRITGDIQRLRASVLCDVRAQSPRLRDGQVRAICGCDLRRVFDAYDFHFFNASLRPLLRERSSGRLNFRVAPRLTRAGGVTTRRRPRAAGDCSRDEYEIAIASRLLFLSFRDGGRPVSVAGHDCTNRLDALLRIMEHELVHLIELLTIGRSSCSARPFQTYARRSFGHTAFTHKLVLPEEHAASCGIRLGNVVAFDHEKRRLVGRVNRINGRVTVLVPDPSGRRFSDGQRYQPFYVPLDELDLA